MRIWQVELSDSLPQDRPSIQDPSIASLARQGAELEALLQPPRLEEKRGGLHVGFQGPETELER